MRTIDVYHRDQKIGELEVLDHIRLPFEDSLQTLFDMTLTATGFLYKPQPGDLTLEEKDGKLIAVVSNPRLGCGDISLIKGFTSDLESYQRDPVMEGLMKEVAPHIKEQRADPTGILSAMFDTFGNYR